MYIVESHASQTEDEEQEVHPTMVELQALHTLDWNRYPGMQMQLVPLRVMNCDWSQVVQSVVLEQLLQPVNKLPHVTHDPLLIV